MEKTSKKKVPFWFPYPSKITIKKDLVFVDYKGGMSAVKFPEIHSIMFYGSICSLPEVFLEKCSLYKIPIVFHKRNMSQAVWIIPSTSKDPVDLLTQQIIFRNNQKKCAYIAKRLLSAKFKSMEWLTAYPADFDGKYLTIPEMIKIEAWHARDYWQSFYQSLGEDGCCRRSQNPISATLDAVSKFVSGIFLRWILFHKISPFHGFVHLPSDYPSLVYDLMEPYRGYIDKEVCALIKSAKENNVEEKEYFGWVLKGIENFLDKKIYTESTRQIVTFQELFHGSVLALRAYISGETRRFVVPTPNRPNGGRPINAGYRLYGRSAGPTDFWQVAKSSDIF